MDSRTAELPLEYLAAPWQIRLHISPRISRFGKDRFPGNRHWGHAFFRACCRRSGFKGLPIAPHLGQPSGTFGEFVGYSAASSRDRLKLAGVWGRNVAVGSAPSRWMQRCARLCPWDWCCWWAAPRICPSRGRRLHVARCGIRRAGLQGIQAHHRHQGFAAPRHEREQISRTGRTNHRRGVAAALRRFLE